jgi:hypothetical protein
VPAVTAGIGAAAAIGGQLVSARFQGRNQERAEERQPRERAVAVLAEVSAWLGDANPNVIKIVIGDSARLRERMSDLSARWRPIRSALLTLIVGHPSEKIRQLSQQLDVAMAKSIKSSMEYLSSLARDVDGEGQVVQDGQDGLVQKGRPQGPRGSTASSQ